MLETRWERPIRRQSDGVRKDIALSKLAEYKWNLASYMIFRLQELKPVGQAYAKPVSSSQYGTHRETPDHRARERFRDIENAKRDIPRC